MPKILKRFFCEHEKVKHVSTFLDDVSPGKYVTRHIWKCENCGKEFVGGK